MLPRRLFLRLSGYLQMAAFCLIVGVYFLQPGFGGLDDLAFGSIWAHDSVAAVVLVSGACTSN